MIKYTIKFKCTKTRYFIKRFDVDDILKWQYFGYAEWNKYISHFQTFYFLSVLLEKFKLANVSIACIICPGQCITKISAVIMEYQR